MQLTLANYPTALSFLSQQDQDLKQIYDAYGQPPTWFRPASFESLVLIILEQQVSLASARASYDKLEQALSIAPEQLIQLDDGRFRELSISRQKATYLRHLSQEILEGRLDLANLVQKSDAEVRTALIRLKGIGSWTANIYLMMALRRRDIWPRGDLALLKAAREVKQQPDLSQEDLETLAQDWQPWRSVAARLLWHYYLKK